MVVPYCNFAKLMTGINVMIQTQFQQLFNKKCCFLLEAFFNVKMSTQTNVRMVHDSSRRVKKGKKQNFKKKLVLSFNNKKSLTVLPNKESSISYLNYSNTLVTANWGRLAQKESFFLVIFCFKGPSFQSG